MKKIVIVILMVLTYTKAWAAETVVPLNDLISEIRQDQMLFDRNYMGKSLSTEGFIREIDKNGGKYVIQLLGNPALGPLDFIECTFIQSQANALRNLKKGDGIVIKGTYKGRPQLLFIAFTLSDCIFLRKSTAVSPYDLQDASDIVSTLRELKYASAMFYADNRDEIDEGKYNNLINAENSVKKLLEKYLPQPVGKEYLFITGLVNGERKWLVGCRLTGAKSSIKQNLKTKVAGSLLLNEHLEPYSGGDLVFIIAR